MKKYLQILVMILALALLTACAPEDKAPEESGVGFTDALGGEVSVKKEPERVAALIGSFADVWVLSGGSVCATVEDAFRHGFHASAGTRIFAYVRLPRTLASLLCGAALAVSGAVIQGVLSNRLASPSIIGVNGCGKSTLLKPSLA